MPDLVLIDGGRGQVGIARGVLADLGLHQVCVVGVAKGRERKYSQELSVVIDRALEHIQRNPTVSQNGSKRFSKIPAGVSELLNR